MAHVQYMYMIFHYVCDVNFLGFRHPNCDTPITHYFGIGPIPKPNIYGQYRKRYWNHFCEGRSSLVWGIFSFLKGAWKTKFACKLSIPSDYFWRSGFIFMLIKTCIFTLSGETREKLEKTWKEILKKFRFPITKTAFSRTLVQLKKQNIALRILYFSSYWSCSKKGLYGLHILF